MSPWLVAFFVVYKFMVPKYFCNWSLCCYSCITYLYSISKIFLKKKLHFFVATFNHHLFFYINKGPQFSLFLAPINYVASHRHSGLLRFPTGVQMWHLEAQRSLWNHIRNKGQNDKQSLCSRYCLRTDTLVLSCRLYISTSIRWFELLFVFFSAMSKSVHM